MRRVFTLLSLVALLCASPASAAAPRALFDNAHAETAGNADWVIDNDQPTPVPAQSGINAGSPNTYWTGAISSWGVSLVKRGYTVTTNTTALTYGNSGNPNDLANFDVLIVPEPNTLFTSAEAAAIKSFIQGGGGLVAISDHSGSDRNNDGQDSPMIWNAFDPTHALGVSFAVAGNANNNIVQTSTNVNPSGTDLVTHGPVGTVTGLAFHNGSTMTLYPSVNSTVRGEVWMNGLSQTSTTGVMCASASYGSGRVVFVGDSSPADDGTAQAGNSSIYDGWGEAGATDSTLFMNATLWVTRGGGGGGGGTGTGYHMVNGNYLESFSDIANWTNNFAAGVGASVYRSVATGGTAAIPNATRITTSTATFTTGTTGGVQKGVSPNPAGTLVLLTTGSTDNSSSAAVDLLLDFTGVNAGTLSFNWSTVFNSTGDRKGSLRVYTSTDGTSFTELTGAAVLNFTNNVAGSGTVSSVALPASFSNSGTARLRFYYHNGSGGTTGSRPKIALDNISVTGTPGSFAAEPAFEEPVAPVNGTLELALAPPVPNPGAGPTRIAFTLPRAGHARLEVLDLSGRRLWSDEGDYAAGTHGVQWSGRGAEGRAPAGVYFVRLVAGSGERTARLVRL